MRLLSNAANYSTLHVITHGYFAAPGIKSIDQDKPVADANPNPTADRQGFLSESRQEEPL